MQETKLLSDAKQDHRLNKLAKRLRSEVGKAIADFNMIEEGDKIMVCLSGGKDSYALLDILRSLQKYAPVNFELLAVNLDQQQPGFPKEVLPNYLESIGVPYRIVNEDTYSVVKRIIEEGKTTCSLCSRLRRGILYRVAQEEKCTKIALGHHRDDMVETLFLNMFFAGKMKSMPPKLVSDNGLHTVIRPLAYCREKDLAKYAQLKEFPIIPCNLCGSQPNLQRKAVKEMLNTWDKQYPGRIETIFRAMQDISTSHMLDHGLYDFKTLSSLSQQQFNPHHNAQGTPVNLLASRTEEANAKTTSQEVQAQQASSQATTNKAVNAAAVAHEANLLVNDEELDQMAQEELFGSVNYDALAKSLEKEYGQEKEELKIQGLKIKQL
ncbi:tRNA 2-thiocytidine(32) synthetase TtcA [Psittacicella hinzii]|uniref:tRNA-cytidine(32) 2-sulfurtransferase n=1 Tax=Psittacicella hinzii TaxID=2028575 RepID=A0A3A1YSZ2_9GAMM|nr:tRNA 2-thiocytidine(32) synthetase TtcA [Psittacicella hinzii]RIY40611.1 tRNA 2-thiocytidine(32) synthetase TtcA [Psittacicella hinzii]